MARNSGIFGGFGRRGRGSSASACNAVAQDNVSGSVADAREETQSMAPQIALDMLGTWEQELFAEATFSGQMVADKLLGLYNIIDDEEFNSMIGIEVTIAYERGSFSSEELRELITNLRLELLLQHA